MITTPAKDLISIGILSCDLQVTVREIERAADELGIEPALSLNRIAHFDGEQIERLGMHLRRPSHTAS